MARATAYLPSPTGQYAPLDKGMFVPGRYDISRQRAESLLLEDGRDGCFLVRKSENIQGVHALCLLFQNEIFNYRLVTDANGKISVYGDNDNPMKFAAIPELISDYMTRGSNTGLACALRYPLQDAPASKKDSPKSDPYGWSEPLCLIENENTKLSVNKETAAKVAEIRDPIVAVAIVGLFRTGKSYLMNRLARKPGFSVAGEVQANTKGIWIWCMQHPQRQNCCLALMDTEGLGDIAKLNASANDTMLFMLATLLSSVLVFNSVGTIDQTAMDKLQFITGMAQNLQVKAGGSIEKNDEVHEFCPSFVWVVRDFALQLVVDGEPITSDQYLEKALVLRDGADPATEKFNKPRLIFRRCFLQRKCFTFPPPETIDMTGAYSLKRIDEAAVEFRRYVIENGNVKAVAGHALNGQKFVRLAEHYAKAISFSKMIVVQSVVEATAGQVNEEAIKASLQLYDDAMMRDLVMPVGDTKQLEVRHESCEKQARQLFDQRAMLIGDDNHKIIEHLAAALVKKYSEICRLDREKSLGICTQLLEKLHEPIKAKIAKGEYHKSGGYKTFQDDVDQTRRRYHAEPGKGTMADTALDTYKSQVAEIANHIKIFDETLSAEERRRAQDLHDIDEQIKDAEKQKRDIDENMRHILEVQENMKSMIERMEQSAKKQTELWESKQEELTKKIVDNLTEKMNVQAQAEEEIVQKQRDSDHSQLEKEAENMKEENPKEAKNAQGLLSRLQRMTIKKNPKTK